MDDPIGQLLDSLGYGPTSSSSGGFDWGSLAAAGIGGLFGAFGGDSSGGGGAQITGYQGGIPRYTASRQYTPAPEGRVPGSAGLSYFTDVVYAPVDSSSQAAPAPAPAPENTNNEPTPQPGPEYSNSPELGMGAAQGGYIRQLAAGGLGSLGSYSDGGRMLKGPGTGQSDDIPATIEDKQPARLARDEFVIPADVVSMLGDGSSDAGAERLYAMMDRIRKMAHGKAKQQNKVNPNKALPA